MYVFSIYMHVLYIHMYMYMTCTCTCTGCERGPAKLVVHVIKRVSGNNPNRNAISVCV